MVGWLVGRSLLVVMLVVALTWWVLCIYIGVSWVGCNGL